MAESNTGMIIALGVGVVALVALTSSKKKSTPPPSVTHLVCSNNNCIKIDGSGADECAIEGEVCGIVGECTDGEVDTRQQVVSCGLNGRGTQLQERSRTCSGGVWQPFTDWSNVGGCSDTDTCVNGTTLTDQRTVPCGLNNRGSQLQERTATCTNGSYGSFSSFENVGGCNDRDVCVDGDERCNGNDLQECRTGAWVTTKTCVQGCSGNACTCNPALVPAECTIPPFNFITSVVGSDIDGNRIAWDLEYHERLVHGLNVSRDTTALTVRGTTYCNGCRDTSTVCMGASSTVTIVDGGVLKMSNTPFSEYFTYQDVNSYAQGRLLEISTGDSDSIKMRTDPGYFGGRPVFIPRGSVIDSDRRTISLDIKESGEAPGRCVIFYVMDDGQILSFGHDFNLLEQKRITETLPVPVKFYYWMEKDLDGIQYFQTVLDCSCTTCRI